jgi:hypothetical protein
MHIVRWSRRHYVGCVSETLTHPNDIEIQYLAEHGKNKTCPHPPCIGALLSWDISMDLCTAIEAN